MQVVVPISAAADDGYVNNNSSESTWPPVLGITHDMTSTITGAKSQLGGGLYYVNVMLLRFATGASLPDDALIESAYLEGKIAGMNGAYLNRNLLAAFYTWTLANADFNADLGVSAAGALSMTGLTTGQTIQIPLYSARLDISLTGTTSLRVGIGGGAPPDTINVDFYAHEHTTEDPMVLRINYSTPSERLGYIQEDPDSPDANWIDN